MFSKIMNLYYNYKLKKEIKKAVDVLLLWSKEIKLNGLPAFRQFMQKCKWTKDKPIGWTPESPLIVIARGWRGDCDDFAVMAKWGFKQLGYDSSYYRLIRSGGAHRVCVNKDLSLFTSNTDVVEIPEVSGNKLLYILNWNWHKDNKYEWIVEA